MLKVLVNACLLNCVVLPAFASQANAYTIQVKAYTDNHVQVSIVAHKKVVASSPWVAPPKRGAEPKAISLPCNDFPCTVRVRLHDGTYEYFGPIDIDSGFDGERSLVLMFKPVWETKTREVPYVQWDPSRRCWRRFSRTTTYKVSHMVPEWRANGFKLPYDDVNVDLAPAPPQN